MMKFAGAALAAFLGLVLSISGVDARGGGGHSGSSHSSSHSSSSSGEHYTHGYFRSNGTYVGGYHATNPNSTRNDNFSTRGNINPYTGKLGTKPGDGEALEYGLGGSNLGTYHPLTASPETLGAGAQTYSMGPGYRYGGQDSGPKPTGPSHFCTHAESVQARIAVLNQYTEMPNCE